jgi:hypothetical protein
VLHGGNVASMKIINIKVGTHHIQVFVSTNQLISFFSKNFKIVKELNSEPDIRLIIIEGFGSPFKDYHVSIKKESNKVYFRRSDYMIESDLDYKNAAIFVKDELALKHALTNFYSSYIVYHNWGLLIHSSCAIEDGKAHIFAGQSGAGKSTAARLSQPRELLSDEATLVQITPDEIKVYNSPFRSEIIATGPEECVTLKSLQLLYQSKQNKRVKIKKADALIHIIDKVFYWAHSPEETKKAMSLLRFLIDKVPVNELYFKKDDTFWELIS